MPRHYFPPIHHVPANGISPRRVPDQMAPERCVTRGDTVAPDVVMLVGRDLDGHIRVRVELSREDASAWWIKVIRHWLAWQYGAAEIRLLS